MKTEILRCLNRQMPCAGPERLKEALAALGLKSGGTPRQRAERLFLTAGTPLEKLDRKHFAKGAAPAALRSAAESVQLRAAARETALLEAKASVVFFLAEAAAFLAAAMLGMLIGAECALGTCNLCVAGVA